MRVYRIEHKDTGNGPFAYGNWRCDLTVPTSHGGPFEGQYVPPGWKFAVWSLADAQALFQPGMATQGYGIVSFEVDDDAIEIGVDQIAYAPNHVIQGTVRHEATPRL